MSIFKAIRRRSYKEKREALSYSKSCWSTSYLCGGFDIKFRYLYSAAVIEVYYKGKRIAEWVDYTDHCPGELGVRGLIVFDDFQYKNLLQAEPAF